MRFLFVIAFLLFWLPAAATGPVSTWEVGRASLVKQAQSSTLLLKVSLRNAGAPAQVPVQILGRWQLARRGAIPGPISANVAADPEPGGYKVLGTFINEVSLKQTTVIDLSLAPLGSLPQGQRLALELIVLTGRQITDRETVYLDQGN